MTLISETVSRSVSVIASSSCKLPCVFSGAFPVLDPLAAIDTSITPTIPTAFSVLKVPDSANFDIQ